MVGFRLAAVGVGLLPFLAAELILRCARITPAPTIDPFVTFSRIEPLFVPDASGQRYETNPEKLTWFRSQSFAIPKPAGTFRIFCLGGSTVQGRPYSVETAFPTWLQLSVQAARPETHWEVINCGGISYASYRLVPILREVLNYEPDLVILCTGHNEFLEDRSYAGIRKMPPFLVGLHRALLHSRCYSLAYHAMQQRSLRPVRRANRLDPEVRARLDVENGLARYHRDEPWRQGVMGHFAANLETLICMARQGGVPLILVGPASNLKDCAPFKSEFAAGTSAADRQVIADRLDRAERTPWSDPYAKLDLLQQAAAIDGHHAGILFRVGRCYLRLGHTTGARRWFIRAKDEDLCPLRITEAMREALHEAAERYDVPFLNAHELFEQATEDGICGHEWLLDHVHPTVEGPPAHRRCLIRSSVRGRLGGQARRVACPKGHPVGGPSGDPQRGLLGPRRPPSRTIAALDGPGARPA